MSFYVFGKRRITIIAIIDLFISNRSSTTTVSFRIWIIVFHFRHTGTHLINRYSFRTRYSISVLLPTTSSRTQIVPLIILVFILVIITIFTTLIAKRPADEPNELDAVVEEMLSGSERKSRTALSSSRLKVLLYNGCFFFCLYQILYVQNKLRNLLMSLLFSLVLFRLLTSSLCLFLFHPIKPSVPKRVASLLYPSML